MLRVPNQETFQKVDLAFWVVAMCSCLLAACGTASGQSLNGFKEGQLINTKTAALTSFEELKPTLLESDVIYIGEEHYIPSHVQAALRILEMLVAEGKQPVVAMEMFSWDGQEGLDRFISGEIQDTQEFLREARWKDNWGGDFAAYEPIITFAKNHHRRLYALNPPRTLVRKVATLGLEKARQDPLLRHWGMNQEISLDDPEYRRVLFEPIEKCHPGMSQQGYQRFYEASIFKDEGMAKVIVGYLQNKAPGVGPLVSYTGGGHIQYKVPIPRRVQRQKPVKDVSVYLMAVDPLREEDIQYSIQEKIADFIWLTPLGPQGPQPRCGS